MQFDLAALAVDLVAVDRPVLGADLVVGLAADRPALVVVAPGLDLVAVAALVAPGRTVALSVAAELATLQAKPKS